jgi:decaprenylphospho-beta-D-ribofuranose 2-oxidase
MGRTLLAEGWGRTPRSLSSRVAVTQHDEVTALVRAGTPRGLLGRGLGRSYGDAALCAGGTLISTDELDGIGRIGVDGHVRCEAGVSIERLLRRSIPRGWFVPVTPGTRQVTIGGAVAADIHGKNHHVDGSIGRHLDAVTLIDGCGEERTLQPGTPELDATTGGLGLTGFILDATLRLRPIETASMRVETTRVADLDECMSVLLEADRTWPYTVAWVDTVARGRHLGRGVVTSGDHASVGDLSGPSADDPLTVEFSQLVSAPPWAPSRLLCRPSIRVFNEALFRKAPARPEITIESISRFFHPLDVVRGWNRLYGRHGFVQHQLAVSDDAAWIVRHAIERLQEAGCPSFLAVLKRFGAGRDLLSFPIPGWTLTLDVPAATPGLAAALDDLDRTIADAGGRVYLAKDARLRAGMVEAMYPQLDRWREIRERMDPRHVFVSDLARRIGLLGTRARA